MERNWKPARIQFARNFAGETFSAMGILSMPNKIPSSSWPDGIGVHGQKSSQAERWFFYTRNFPPLNALTGDMSTPQYRLLGVTGSG